LAQDLLVVSLKDAVSVVCAIAKTGRDSLMQVFSKKTLDEKAHILEYARMCAKLFENVDFETHNKQLIKQNGRLVHTFSGPLYLQFFNSNEMKS
jgi:hypothetical protein